MWHESVNRFTGYPAYERVVEDTGGNLRRVEVYPAFGAWRLCIPSLLNYGGSTLPVAVDASPTEVLAVADRLLADAGYSEEG